MMAQAGGGEGGIQGFLLEGCILVLSLRILFYSLFTDYHCHLSQAELSNMQPFNASAFSM